MKMVARSVQETVPANLYIFALFYQTLIFLMAMTTIYELDESLLAMLLYVVSVMLHILRTKLIIEVVTNLLSKPEWYLTLHH